MNERRSFSYVNENPYAAYAFVAHGAKGYRVYLQREEILFDGDLYEKVNSESRKHEGISDSGLRKYVVLFSVDEVLPLVGG